MSHTDKTRPWYVKAMDRPSFLAESHDHRFGPCDLPERPLKEADPAAGTRHSATRCSWKASQEYWYAPVSRCGCRLCTDHFGRKAKARRERYEGRQFVKNWDQQY